MKVSCDTGALRLDLHSKFSRTLKGYFMTENNPHHIPPKRASYLQKFGPSLISKGYKIVPIKICTKAPIGIPGWQNIHADQNKLQEWLNQGYEGVGVLCRNNPAVDIDILDEEVLRQMVEAVLQLYSGGLVRVGKAPKTLLAYRTDKPFKKVKSCTYEDKYGNCHAVEILGDGQQYVAYAEHPDTLKPYEWTNASLADVNSDDLPVLNFEDAHSIVKVFEEIAKGKVASNHWTKSREGSGGSLTSHGSNDNAQDSSELLLANFAALRPPLNITVPQIRHDLSVLFSDDYDRWIHVGMALWHQFNGDEEGFELWDEWSTQAEKYTGVEDLRTRWAGFKPDPNQRPLTFATVRRMANIARMEEDPLPEFLNRFFYVMDGDAVYDLEGLAHDKPAILKEFKNMYANIRMEIEVPAPVAGNDDRTKTKMVPVTSQWMVDPERKSAQGFTYRPGGSEILKDAEGRQWINKFHMPVFANPCPMVIQNGETKMDPEHIESLLKNFFQHMEYIIPLKEEREWFYSWMAFNIQKPDIRCKVTPLLIATDHGTGRGWIVQLMNLLLGSWNCSKTKMSTLSGESSAGQYQDFMNETLFCAVEEVKDADKPYGVLDSIRSYLTEDMLEINLKYGAKETKRVYTNFLWNSNHADALVLKAEDRRVNVFKTVDGPKDNDYYDRLYEWLEAEDKANERINVPEQTVEGEDEVYDRAGVKVSAGVACLFHWLKSRDLADFNWKRSMHNKARQDLIENSQTNIEYYFLELVKNPPYEIMTLAEIKSELEMQKNELSGDSFLITDSEKRQLKKLAQQHLGKQKRIKISRAPDPDGDEWVTIKTPYEVHYWSFDKKKTFGKKEMREIHYARKKW
jgi:hypothetical protein